MYKNKFVFRIPRQWYLHSLPSLGESLVLVSFVGQPLYLLGHLRSGIKLNYKLKFNFWNGNKILGINLGCNQSIIFSIKKMKHNWPVRHGPGWVYKSTWRSADFNFTELQIVNEGDCVNWIKKNDSCINFTNILQAAFVPISFREKNTNLSRKYKKAAQKIF